MVTPKSPLPGAYELYMSDSDKVEEHINMIITMEGESMVLCICRIIIYIPPIERVSIAI